MASFGEGFLSRSTGVVFACTVGIALGLTSTVQTVFSLFLVPISNEFETSRSSVSAVLLLIALSNALVYPLIGRLADRFGARIIIMTGLLIFVLSVACASLVQSLIHLYVVYFMIGVSGSVLGPILFTKIIAGWFDNNRGFYLGVIGGVGNGIGSTLMPIFVFMLMSDHGWRFAYQGIALLILIIGFPVLYSLLRDPPDSIKALTDSKVSDAEDATDRTGLTLSQSRQTKTFWLLLVSISLCTGCLMAVFTHIIPILTDRGLSMKDATSVLATFAMMTVVAQVSIGALLDKLTRPRAIAPFFIIAALGIGIIGSSSSIPMLLLSAALMGFGLGAEFGLLPYSISRYFGLRDYGSISGVMYSIVALTTGFTPVLMDVVFDVFGDYKFALLAALAGMLVGAIIIASMSRFDALNHNRIASADGQVGSAT